MRFFLFVIIVVFSTHSYAEIYKWVDENGQTHYSQSPPDKNAREITLPPSSAQPGEKEKIQQRLQEQEKFLRALDEERQYQKKLADEEEKRQQQIKAHEKYCREMRLELQDMERGGVVWYELDKNGERVFLSEEEVETKKQDLRQRIKKDCSN